MFLLLICPFPAPHMLCYIEDSQYETEKNKNKVEVTYLFVVTGQRAKSNAVTALCGFCLLLASIILMHKFCIFRNAM